MFTNKRRVLFQQNRSYIQDFDQEIIDVVLQINNFLSLQVYALLKINHHFNQVFSGLSIILSQNVVRETASR